MVCKTISADNPVASTISAMVGERSNFRSKLSKTLSTMALWVTSCPGERVAQPLSLK